MQKYIILLAVIFVVICNIAFAKEYKAYYDTKEDNISKPASNNQKRFNVGAGYWYTWGSLDSFVYNADFGGAKVSELNYDTDAGLFVVNMDTWLFWRMYADASIAWGSIEGSLTDSDWMLPSELYVFDGWIGTGQAWADYFGADINSPFSVSKSDTEGDTEIWNINGYFRVLEQPNSNGYLDVGLGYFYYQDNIEHITDGVQTVLLWFPTDIPFPSNQDSSDKYTFDGLRLGLRSRIPLHNRIAINVSGGISPWLNAEKDMFWNLRNDFGLPAGMESKVTTDGFAFDINLGVEFKIVENLFLEAGYKYLNLQSNKGDDERLWLSGVTATFEDAVDMEVNRGGFYGMARLKF